MLRKLTISEVKKRLRRIHGDVVILDESTYVNTKIKCRFIDKDYGEFWATPGNIFHFKSGHHKRGNIKQSKAITISVDIIKQRIYNVHGNIVTLDESTYTNTQTKCRFLDKDYGEFWAYPSNVLKQDSHPKRSKEKTKKTMFKRYGTESHFQNKEIKEKIEQTNLERYGTKCSLQNEEVKKKKTETCLKNHGVEYPMQNEEIRKKVQQTMLKNHGVEHPMQSEEIRKKIEQTNLERYGVENAMQNPEIALKAAKAQNNSYILKHWKTNKEVICTAGYEKATVEYFNINQTNYNWQTKAFKMPNGKTYRPDCYLPDQDLWIEIKGYFREKAKEKWEWFHKEYPNSELWNEKKLKELKIL